MAGRVTFCRADGAPHAFNSGAPLVLAAFGGDDSDILAACGIDGAFVPLRLPRGVLVAALEPTWREAVADVIRNAGGPVSLADLYRAFRNHPKTRANRHWQAKIRQTVQGDRFERVGPGMYQASLAL